MSDDHGKALSKIQEHRELSPLVETILEQNPTPEVLEKLLAVQREWEAGEARRAFTRALVALKRDLPSVLDRDAAVDYRSKRTGSRTYYRHTTLAAAMDAITRPLVDHGFSVSWEPTTSDRLVSVTCRLTHADGHSEAATLSSPPDSKGDKGPAQAVASTVTLLSRYTLLSLLGIATRDMPEPHGPEPQERPDAVDAKASLELAAKLRKHDLAVDEAEKLTGRAVKEWTGADLATISAWAREELQRRSEPEPAE